jgi:DNA-binding transcriptional LysR family regulator
MTFKQNLRMESLANLECFVRSADLGGFSAAARQLGLTPAAVSRNVAALEANLGVRLFQRSTRRLALTEAGERFLLALRSGLDSVQAAIAGAGGAGQPAGVLKLSTAVAFGQDYLLPMLPDFLARYPAIVPDWHLDNRQVDLIGQGFDVAIGGGIELAPGIVARELAPVHVVAVASPAYLATRPMPTHPDRLATCRGIALRSALSGRRRVWTMRNRRGQEASVDLEPAVVLNDPEAACGAARLGIGVAMLPMPHALPYLERGELTRLLPGWHADAGTISIYFVGGRLMPAKTRAFVDFVVEEFRRRKLAQKFAAA